MVGVDVGGSEVGVVESSTSTIGDGDLAGDTLLAAAGLVIARSVILCLPRTSVSPLISRHNCEQCLFSAR